MNFDELLPMGSVVYLNGGNIPLLIVGVCKMYLPVGAQRYVYYDYAATSYPTGYDTEHLYYFNHENVSQIAFRGMVTRGFLKFLKEMSTQVVTLQARGELEIGRI